MLSTPLPVAVVQLNSQDDLVENLGQCKALVFEAAAAGAKVVLLPENFAFFGREEERKAVAESLWPAEGHALGGQAGGASGTGGAQAAGGSFVALHPVQRALSSWSKQLGITLIGGGMPIASDTAGCPYNTSVVFTKGELVAHYHKVHLFDVALADGSELRESDGTTPGSRGVVAKVAGVGFGLSVCYDLRFPELYRSLVDQGALVLTVPAAFTLQTGKDHWEVLLRARAIESQCWVMAAGQFGTHPMNRRCFGNSMVIDPWGAVVSRCSEQVGYAMAKLDLGYLERVRQSVPSLKHRRL